MSEVRDLLCLCAMLSHFAGHVVGQIAALSSDPEQLNSVVSLYAAFLVEPVDAVNHRRVGIAYSLLARIANAASPTPVRGQTDTCTDARTDVRTAAVG